ncbi:MAG: cysteine--tRNA ligase, partial [Candidatus Methanomethylophilaceae archaeon]|nr:cysteine--tRNA ligase [Candidatus Methanomethylophilaceae archaeon]
FFTVKDVAEKFDTSTIRFYFLNTHYMSPLVYGEDMLEEAKAALGRILNNYGDLKSYVKTAPEGDAESDDCCDLIEGYRQAFRDAMDDDFNTRQAIEVLFQMVRATNKSMADKTLSKKAAQRHIALIDEFNGILNIIPEEEEDDGTLDSVMSILIDLRAELRKNKMYNLADMIRDRLGEAGIRLEDSSDGAKWKKV